MYPSYENIDRNLELCTPMAFECHIDENLLKSLRDGEGECAPT